MAVPGSTQRLTVTFYDEPGGTIVDPTGVTLTILLDGVVVHGPIEDPVKDGIGLYHYDWAIPLTTLVGTYVAQWSAVLPGQTQPSLGYESVEITASPLPAETPNFGGCLWPLNEDCLGDEWSVLSQNQKFRAHSLASATLRRLTGGRVGACSIKVRPCKPSVFYRTEHWLNEYRPFHPMITTEGSWVNVGCCTSSSCSCESVCSIPLPRPATFIEEVRVDGAVVDPANYFLHDSKVVWSSPEPCPFPAAQDLSKPDTEPGTLSVTFLNGYPVDSIGACAVATLALEFAKSFTGSNKCRLPSNVRNINRQGVSMELVVGAFTDGVTGLREVDSYIALWNPTNLRSDSRVWSPDMPRNR